MPIQHQLRRIIEQRETLSIQDAADLMQQILQSQASDIELAALLGALAARGETAEEIAGFALTLRSASNTLPLNDLERHRTGRHLRHRRRRQRHLQHLHRRRPRSRRRRSLRSQARQPRRNLHLRLRRRPRGPWYPHTAQQFRCGCGSPHPPLRLPPRPLPPPPVEGRHAGPEGSRRSLYPAHSRTFTQSRRSPPPNHGSLPVPPRPPGS